VTVGSQWHLWCRCPGAPLPATRDPMPAACLGGHRHLHARSPAHGRMFARGATNRPHRAGSGRRREQPAGATRRGLSVQARTAQSERDMPRGKGAGSRAEQPRCSYGRDRTLWTHWRTTALPCAFVVGTLQRSWSRRSAYLALCAANEPLTLRERCLPAEDARPGRASSAFGPRRSRVGPFYPRAGSAPRLSRPPGGDVARAWAQARATTAVVTPSERSDHLVQLDRGPPPRVTHG
jgi:hypothetical protein